MTEPDLPHYLALIQSTSNKNLVSDVPDMYNTSISSNDTIPIIRETSIQILFSLIYATIFVLGVFGNVLVCYVVFHNKNMHTVTNFFITNLALSDILLCILAVPFTPTYTFLENCPAFIKLSKDESKILKSNNKHKHSSSGYSGEVRGSDTSSTSSSSPRRSDVGSISSSNPRISPCVSRTASLDKSTSASLLSDSNQEDPNVSTESTETVVHASTFDAASLLPDNHSILSMGTPTTDLSINSTFGTTPLVRDQTKDLRFQIHSLTQEIINKQIQINNLNKKAEQNREELERMKTKAELDESELRRLKLKSEEDDKIIKEMIESIRTLEGIPERKKSGGKLTNRPTTSKQKKKNTEESQKTISNKTVASRCNNSSSDGGNGNKAQERVQFSNRSKTRWTPSAEERNTGLVVLGDSHVRNMRTQLEKELPVSFKIHAHFKPGGTYQEIANSISSNDLEYEKVFVMAGTNDICHSSWTEVENAVIEIRCLKTSGRNVRRYYEGVRQIAARRSTAKTTGFWFPS
ncbi:hypothetical protein M8J77_000517 [Diaphorina citri]|nr:hypothetical protein M8J77_000517 [Diaphorina citri]